MELKETKEMALFIIEASESISKSWVDGKFEPGKLVNMLPLIIKAPEAIKGSEKIYEEFKVASSEARAALIEEMKQSLDLENDVLEYKIEAALVFANQAAIFWAAMKGK